MVSPRPVPTGAPSVPSTNRENGSNSRARPSGGMTGPRSRTAKRSHGSPCVRCDSTVILHLARRSELHRVGQQVDQHLPQPPRILVQLVGNAAPDRDPQHNAPFGRLRTEHLDHALDQRAQVEAAGTQRQLARVHARHLQHIADQRRQCVAGLPSGVQQHLLGRGHSAIGQQREAVQQRVERCADLVRDDGDKARRRPAGRRGHVAGVRAASSPSACAR